MGPLNGLIRLFKGPHKALTYSSHRTSHTSRYHLARKRSHPARKRPLQTGRDSNRMHRSSTRQCVSFPDTFSMSLCHCRATLSYLVKSNWEISGALSTGMRLVFMCCISGSASGCKHISMALSCLHLLKTHNYGSKCRLPTHAYTVCPDIASWFPR